MDMRERLGRRLDEHGWAAWILDPELNVVWVSREFEHLLGRSVHADLIGKHFMVATLSEHIRSIVTERSLLRAGADLIPFYCWHTPGGVEAVKAILESELGEGAGSVVDRYAIERPDPVLSYTIEVKLSEGMEPEPTNFMVIEINSQDGEVQGFLSMFVGTLPFRFVPLLARGDEDTLTRMVALAEPGHRPAAILFADLQASGVLSSRLPSELYFRLVRELIAVFDDEVTSRAGIVGRHAGDGVTGFFIPEESASQAVRCAIQAANAIVSKATELGAKYEEQTEGLVSSEDLLVNVGLHWSSSIYMGQLVSNGRLEVTALGDAVNECARLQDTASDGQIVASKALLEHLSPEDAAAADVPPSALAYQRLANLPNATEKAVRDAGGISVAIL